MRLMNIGTTAINMDNVLAIEAEDREEGCLLTFEFDRSTKQTMIGGTTANEVYAAIGTALRQGDCSVNAKHFDLVAAIGALRAGHM